MIVRFWILFLCAIAGYTLWDAAGVNSLNAALKMLLLWAVGALTGLLLALDWLMKGKQQKEETSDDASTRAGG